MLAILSDVHANLEALQAVLTDARDHGAATCISLGDHIGFNGDPAACLDLLIPRLSAAVQGNHEAELLHPGTFGVPLYEHMMQRTAAMLSPWHMDWLAQLPLTRSYGSLHLLHAPTDGHRWKRISTPSQAAALLRSQPQPLFLTGHTHRPAVFTQRGSTTTQVPLCYDATGTCKLTLETTARYLINPGSVGQPRDCIAAAQVRKNPQVNEKRVLEAAGLGRWLAGGRPAGCRGLAGEWHRKGGEPPRLICFSYDRGEIATVLAGVRLCR